jgi:hypothetical protein
MDDGREGQTATTSVEFNPPVRFLQTSGHRAAIGITYDTTNLQVIFKNVAAEQKFKHLIHKLVVHPTRGLGATATYDDVFADFSTNLPSTSAGVAPSGTSTSPRVMPSPSPSASTSTAPSSPAPKAKLDTLFFYPVTVSNALLNQLMKEAKELNYKKYPASGTFLLRNIVESLLKHLIDEQKANPASKTLDLEGSINLCISSAMNLGKEDRKILYEFKKNHLDYLNLGSHGNIIPNASRLLAARDTIDQFIKKNI